MTEEQGGPGPPLATVAELFADKYRVVEALAWGGLALMYRAERPDGVSVIIGLLPIDCESSPARAEHFHSRVAELGHLVEPGVVRITGHGIQHGVPYLEMVYVDGATTLAEELEEGPLDRDQALGIVSELLDILGRAHAIGAFHWDLTPSNILLAPGDDGGEHVHVLGFGIAAFVRESRDKDETGPTGRGSGPSARRYLAPELLGLGKPDLRADVFSVGAVLHHMLTGAPPGKGSITPPGDLAPAIALAMSERPDDRPQDAAGLGFALAEGASGAPPQQPSFVVSPPARPRSYKPPPPPPPAPEPPEEHAVLDETQDAATMVMDRPSFPVEVDPVPERPSFDDTDEPFAPPPKSTPPRARSTPPPADVAWPPPKPPPMPAAPPPVAAGDGRESWPDLVRNEAPAAAPPAPAPSFDPFTSGPPAAASGRPIVRDPFAPQVAAQPHAGATDLSAFDTAPQGQSGRTGKIAAIIVFAIAALLVIAFFWVRAGASPREQTTPTQPPAPPPAAPEPSPEPPPEPGPASLDYLEGELPTELQTLAGRVARADEASRDEINALYDYIHAHPDDARGHMLMARAFMDRGWSSDSIDEYLEAYEIDPNVTRDRRMLDDLVELCTRDQAGPTALRALSRTYGRAALPAIERALAASPLPPAARRLERARDDISNATE